jgi:hypothetical protein
MHHNSNIVTNDPGSKPNQRYARRRDRHNYIRKIKYKFRTSSKMNFKLVEYIGTLGGCGLQGCCKFYDDVCHAEGFGLLFS